ncbi:unnamed protein product [Trifolium pratense]|uniref:Uncharacterized protein n=2 Tax=Trifolium pratense TaxID=57577 RepID=A0ACB0M1V9_TRIPR|nr:unnamed protein product [Trifolium pratense]
METRRQNSGGSKSWEEDIYWTHFQFIHFTQFLTTDFQQQLALPKTFSDNLKKLPENVTLKGPSGVMWNVGLTTRDDTLYFTNGWQEFMKDHSLKENDFLVFKYNGESLFEVFIFDGESNCEKAASYFVGKCGDAQTEQGGNEAKDTKNSVEEFNTASDGGVECGSPEKFQHLNSGNVHTEQGGCEGKDTNNCVEEVNTASNGGVECCTPLKFRSVNSIRTPLVAPSKTSNEKTFNAGVESASPEQFMADAVTKTAPVVFHFHRTGKRTKRPFNEVMSTPSKRRKGSPKAANSWQRGLDWLACNKEHSDILYRNGKEDDHYILSGASLSTLSAREEKKIAQSFTSSFPYFVKIIKTFNVSGSQILNIPYEFSMAHLPNCNIKIILHNLKGEHWTVNSVTRTRVHTNHTLCGGWLDFVRDNGIKVGDVCIFELIRECELRVHIAEVGKDGLDSQIEKLASSMLSARCDVACHKTSRYMPKNPKTNSMCRNKVDKVDLSNKKLSKIGQGAALSILKKYGRASNTSKKMGICPKSKAVHKKLALRRKHRVEKDQSSQANAGVRKLCALNEQRVAEAFGSPFPNFVKVMKNFNISGSYTLKIPNWFSVAHLPGCKTEVTLRNSRGECWTVNSVPDAKLRKNYTFCGGWNTFVRDNDINIGDTCIFELVSHYVMQVHKWECET